MAEDAGMPRRIVTMSGEMCVRLEWPDIVAWVDGAGMHDVSSAWRRDIMLLSAYCAAETNRSEAFETEVPWQPD